MIHVYGVLFNCIIVFLSKVPLVELVGMDRTAAWSVAHIALITLHVTL